MSKQKWEEKRRGTGKYRISDLLCNYVVLSLKNDFLYNLLFGDTEQLLNLGETFFEPKTKETKISSSFQNDHIISALTKPLNLLKIQRVIRVGPKSITYGF